MNAQTGSRPPGFVALRRAVLVAVIAWIGACVDERRVTGHEEFQAVPWPGIVSDPVTAGSIGRSGAASALGATSGADVVYISLAPGTIPDGEVANIRNRVTGSGLVAAMVAGGLDPVPVSASAGDTLDIAVRLAGSDSTLHFVHAVAAARRPIVVRTDPPPRKRDVPLNAVMLVVFSEPIDARTLTPETVELRHNGDVVTGTLVLAADGLTLALRPDSLLLPLTDYRLQVTTGVTDRDGDSLESPVDVGFATAASPPPPPPPPDTPVGIASVTLSPDALTLPALDGWRMTVKLWDANGSELVEPPASSRFVVTLTSSNLIVRRPPTITSDYCGSSFPTGYAFCPDWNTIWIQPVAEGSATLIATWEGVSDTAVITVGRRREVATVKVVPSQWTMRPQDTLKLRAHLLDAGGREITWLNGGPRPITWTTDNPAVVTVDTIPRSCADDTNGGLQPWAPQYVAVLTRACAAWVSAQNHGVANVSVSADGASATAAVSAPHLAFASVTAGGHQDIWYLNDFIGHTCGITVSGVTVCWGGDRGAVGDEWHRYSTSPWGLSGGLAFRSVSAGDLFACGLSLTGDAYCWSSTIYRDEWWDYWESGRTAEPSLVPGGHSFLALDAGAEKTCGLTAEGTVYCWDWSAEHYCGQTEAGTWYCLDQSRGTPPVAVSTQDRFVALSVGGAHACALATSGAAYCWGSNATGQLGDGSFADSPTPVAVAGGHSFVGLETGSTHTCGLVEAGDVYCWGNNSSGQLGHGPGGDSPVPTSVSGGLGFVALSGGGAAATTCGITAAAEAYCWGHNGWSQLGDGTNVDRLVPTPVAGGLRFASISTGERHTCGVTTEAVAYCWGWNGAGQLGDGNDYPLYAPGLTSSTVPVRVAGQP